MVSLNVAHFMVTSRLTSPCPSKRNNLANVRDLRDPNIFNIFNINNNKKRNNIQKFPHLVNTDQCIEPQRAHNDSCNGSRT